jgi:Tol biopolymer transport system component
VATPTSDRAGNGFNIWTMRADGTDPRQLTTTPDAFPVWSPNGRKILFNRKGTGERQIFEMRADGSHQRQLTAIAGTDNRSADWQPS